MHSGLEFSLETVNGDRLGKLAVPFAQIADWLNLLTSPHYEVEIVYTEQQIDGITLYFEASEALYWYIGDRLNSRSCLIWDTELLLAS